MMLLSSVLAAFMAFAPAPGGARARSMEEAVDLGPFRIERRSELTWPGLYVPDFELNQQRRWMHSFSLGVFSQVNPLRFKVVTVEPPDSSSDEGGASLSPRRAFVGHIWTAASVELPSKGGHRALSVGRLWFPGTGNSLRRGLSSAAAKIVLSGRM